MRANEEHRFLRSMTEHMAEGVVALDTKGQLMFINPEGERLLGWSWQELAGESVHDRIHSTDSEGRPHSAADCPVLQTIGTGKSYRAEDDVLTRKDGSRFPAAYVAAPMREGGEIFGVVVVFRDITQQKRAEAEQQLLIDRLSEAQEQLLQSEKMASIGQLAAGVAHEINNPVGYVSSNLATLQGYIEELRQLLESYRKLEEEVAPENGVRSEVARLRETIDLDFLQEDLQDLVTESREGIDRVRGIVQSLKDFSHADEGVWQWSDLHHNLDSTLNIVWNEIKYKAEVIKEYEPDLPQVECIASQLNQVFMNLLINAAHAIEKRGTITIRTGAPQPDQVEIELRDTGSGIPDKDMKRIFDPFYTTKPVGQGTGLGLSLSYGIIKRHGGSIEVESEPGIGTLFRLRLPVQKPKSGEAV